MSIAQLTLSLIEGHTLTGEECQHGTQTSISIYSLKSRGCVTQAAIQLALPPNQKGYRSCWLDILASSEYDQNDRSFDIHEIGPLVLPATYLFSIVELKIFP